MRNHVWNYNVYARCKNYTTRIVILIIIPLWANVMKALFKFLCVRHTIRQLNSHVNDTIKQWLNIVEGEEKNYQIFVNLYDFMVVQRYEYLQSFFVSSILFSLFYFRIYIESKKIVVIAFERTRVWLLLSCQDDAFSIDERLFSASSSLFWSACVVSKHLFWQ